MYSIGYLFVYRAEMHVASGLVAIGYSASPLLAMFGMRIAFGQAMSARMMLGALLGIARSRARLLASSSIDATHRERDARSGLSPPVRSS